MTPFPRLVTARLCLRAHVAADAPQVTALAGDCAVADQTLLPHPYADGMAEAWFAQSRRAFERGEGVHFAIERTVDGVLMGGIGLVFEPLGARARLGYWLGRPFWGRGYATEAAGAVAAYGFETLGLERVWAPRFRGNRASARVLEKLGFVHEGSRRQFVVERGRAETVEQHGMLRWEYFARGAPLGFAPRAHAAADSRALL